MNVPTCKGFAGSAHELPALIDAEVARKILEIIATVEAAVHRERGRPAEDGKGDMSPD